MIYVTGDIHGDIVSVVEFAQKNKLGKDDYIIIAGDFGVVFHYPDRIDDYNNDNKKLDALNGLDVNILFVDGNHENFDILNTFPIIDKFGGKVIKLRDTVYNLKRGEVFVIDGIKILTVGGAKSIDKQNRIIYKLKEGVDIWWEGEMLSVEDEKNTFESMDKNDWKVDYIITHTCPDVIIKPMFNYSYILGDRTSQFFDHIYHHEDLVFKKWIFGHFHDDIDFNEFKCIYEDFYKL